MSGLYSFVRNLWTYPLGTLDWDPYTPPTTPRTPPYLDPDDFLAALRPTSILRRTRRLPSTPTKSHQAPERKVYKQKKNRAGKTKAFKCPSCKCRITITPSGQPRKKFEPYVEPPQQVDLREAVGTREWYRARGLTSPKQLRDYRD